VRIGGSFSKEIHVPASNPRPSLFVASFGLVLALAGCFGGSSSGGGGGGNQNAAAAAALVKGMTFDNGSLESGPMPPSTASDVTLLPLKSATLNPGDNTLWMLSVTNPDSDTNPVAATLLQFSNVDQHFRVDANGDKSADAGTSSGNKIPIACALADNVCDTLCDTTFPVTVTQAVELRDGGISARATTMFTLDCTSRGDHSKCAKAITPVNGGDGSGSGNSAVARDVTATIQAYTDAACQCDSTLCSLDQTTFAKCYGDTIGRHASEIGAACIAELKQSFVDATACFKSPACTIDTADMCITMGTGSATCDALPQNVQDTVQNEISTCSGLGNIDAGLSGGGAGGSGG
jgi:hypothetical protein